MGFFDAQVFTTLFTFRGAMCTQFVHIAIVLRNGNIKVYGDPQEGARVMGEAVVRGKRRSGEYLAQSPLKPLTMSLTKMNKRSAKKTANSFVAHMLGVTGKCVIKWGKADAVFWGTDIPVFGTLCIANVMQKRFQRQTILSG